jgi:hypothetical protein
MIFMGLGIKWLHEAVCSQSLELWGTVEYMKQCVDRDWNCSRYLVLLSWQYVKSQNALCQTVYGER